MAPGLRFFLFLLLASTAIASAQSLHVSSSYNLVLIFVDFKDGRKPDGSLPTTDQDLKYFNDTTINAVGSMGYVNVNPSDPHATQSPKRRMIRKYTYDDYWDMYFTVGTYAGTMHPDYASHGIRVYGSLRDYYNEATYRHVQIVPYPTWPGGTDKYRVGIVNRHDEVNGKRFVRWILISPLKKSNDYSYPSPQVLDDARNAVRSRHALSKDDPEYIPFDLDTYLKASPKNKVIFVGAGGGKSGYARGLQAQEIWLTEKPGRLERSNAFPASILEGIQGCAHEFAHLLGVEHFLAGSYDPMSWGGVGPDSTYEVYDYCPPHFNPWVKLKTGWIPPGKVIRVTSSRTVTLPPVDKEPVVALITLYGDAGRNGDYSHSEYFLVEYRKREGFNRFAGGISTPGFSGGALIWHYTNYHPFAVSGQILEPRLGLKLPDYGMKLKSDPGSPSHFFWAKHPKLNAATLPASNSAAGRQTGISISGFTVKHGKLSFNVTYSQGGIPRWNRFFVKGERVPEKLKGKVYAEVTATSAASLVLQGADLYLSPGSSFSTELTASDSKIHLLEDARCTVTGKITLDGAMRISGSGTFSVNPGSTLIVGPKGRVDVGKETRMTLAPGMKLLLDPGAVVDVKGELSAPDSIARRMKRAK